MLTIEEEAGVTIKEYIRNLDDEARSDCYHKSVNPSDFDLAFALIELPVHTDVVLMSNRLESSIKMIPLF